MPALGKLRQKDRQGAIKWAPSKPGVQNETLSQKAVQNVYKGQWDASAGKGIYCLAWWPQFILGTHVVVEGENQLRKVFLWLPHVGTLIHTCISPYTQVSQVWRHTSAVPALRRRREGDQESKTIFWWVWGQPELHGTLSQNTKQQQQKTAASLADGRIQLLKSYIWLLIGTINRNGVCPTKPCKAPQDTGSEEWSPKMRKGNMEEYETLAVKVPWHTGFLYCYLESWVLDTFLSWN